MNRKPLEDDSPMDEETFAFGSFRLIPAQRMLLERYLAPLGPLAVAIDGNAVVVAERADPRLGPAVAAPGWLSGAIEEPRDLLVGHQARQLADQRQGVFGHRPAMLADPIHPQIQHGVVPTLPMQ